MNITVNDQRPLGIKWIYTQKLPYWSVLYKDKMLLLKSTTVRLSYMLQIELWNISKVYTCIFLLIEHYSMSKVTLQMTYMVVDHIVRTTCRRCLAELQVCVHRRIPDNNNNWSLSVRAAGVCVYVVNGCVNVCCPRGWRLAGWMATAAIPIARGYWRSVTGGAGVKSTCHDAPLWWWRTESDSRASRRVADSAPVWTRHRKWGPSIDWEHGWQRSVCNYRRKYQ